MPDIPSRFKKAWNIFFNKKTADDEYEWANPKPYGYSSGMSGNRPDRTRRYKYGKNRTILQSIYTRIATDVAAVSIEHCRVDENNTYLETIHSELNRIFSEEANIDQTGRAFVQDLVSDLCEYGWAVILPVDTDTDLDDTGTPTIYSARLGTVEEWFPYSVRVKAWNERTGQYEKVKVRKDSCAIIPNPFYAVMNENNSVVDRLTRKLAILDAIDEQSGSGKLDLIVQLPYLVKSDAKRQQAEHRRKDIEEQLSDSKYGIAYIDGTERITQLNRSVENNLLQQIQYLTDTLYSQLGLTPAVFNGTADEKEMLNYYNRTIEPFLAAICDECRRKFLTRTARTQGQTIKYFNDPFKLVPVDKIGDIADKFTRNEILTSNEIRAIIGYKPSDEPNADELRNKNLNQPPEAMTGPGGEPELPDDEEELERILAEAGAG